MGKLFLLILGLLIFAGGCGQKSTIKNQVKAERLANAYGDGRHIIRNLTFPLEDSTLAFKTPLPGIAPIVGGIVKFVGDIFARSTAMGKLQMSYTQAIPELPAELHSVRLKRFFFYLKPRELKGRKFKDLLRAWVDRYILDKGDPTFGFLDKLAVKMATTNVENPDTYESELIDDISDEDRRTLLKLFQRNQSRVVVDTEIAKEINLIKYHKKNKKNDNTSEKYGAIHYLELDRNKIKSIIKEELDRKRIPYTNEALERFTSRKVRRIQVDLKSFFMDDVQNWKNFERVLIFENSLLVELKKDTVSNEIFKKIMNENAERIEHEFFVNYIDTCSVLSCLEVNVPNINLIPIAKKGNAIRFDALIHADTVPDSFKLKGFVEIEVKVDSPI